VVYYDQECVDLGYSYCSRCLPRGCLGCFPDFYSADNGTCSCAEGLLIHGVCNTIVGCVQPTVLPDGSKSCLACSTVYFFSQPANNGSCLCQSGDLVNGICNSVPGCITPDLAANGSVICLACFVSAKFRSEPQASGLCGCIDKYSLSKGVCA
jgi:hypothetical protein